MKKYFVESLGTFTLTLVVVLSVAGSFPISTPVLAALTLGLFVYSVGHISGTHINPAVTLGLWSIGKIKSSEALNYIGSQFIGAGLAFLLITLMDGDIGVKAGLTVSNALFVGFAELVGTFFFTFGIASVVYDKVPGQMNGLVVGGSLLLGITLAVLLGSNGVLNPAVAFGIGSFGIMYILGPILGSILGMKAYKFLEN